MPNSGDNDLRYVFISEATPRQLSQITALYRQAGWWGAGRNDNPGLVSRIISGSHAFLVVVKGDEIVGMGRAISDRASDAYIQDVTVVEPHRMQGVGGGIVKRIVERLHEDGIRWIGLIAENDSRLFYERLGFAELPSSSKPMLMIKTTRNDSDAVR